MRLFLPNLLTLCVLTLGVGVSSCRCSPASPVPITMKVINGTSAPLYVDATQQRLGLTVQREVGGKLFGFDDLACACRFCTNACSASCTCPDAGSPQILRVDPGGSAQRAWSGVVMVSGSTTCGDGTCLDPENAPVNETFSLQLCYSTQKPNNVFDDAGVTLGSLDTAASTCLTKTFQVQDGVVEIGPTPGAACATSADCKGATELCFGGSCTAGCPGNDYPTDTGWALYVAGPDDMGFFTQSARGAGSQYAGTGTISAVVFSGSSLEVSLTRPGAGSEQLTGKLTVQLPPGIGPPLQSGAAVTVTVIDDGQRSPNRAVTIRDSVTGSLLFAADMAQGTALLTSADTSPFTVGSSQEPVGCRQTDCGRFVYFGRQVTLGNSAVNLEPGSSGTLTGADGTSAFLSITDGKYQSTQCDVADLRPWVMWKQP